MVRADRGLKIKKEITTKFNLITNHEGKNLVITYPFWGPNRYDELASQIDSVGLLKPTAAQVASFLYSAHLSKDKYSKEIIKIFRRKYFRAFTGVLWTKEGVYVQDNPTLINGYPDMKECELQDKLKNSQGVTSSSHDGTIRFSQYGFKLWYQNSNEIQKNDLAKILFGEEGVQILAKLTRDKYDNRAFIWGLGKVEIPQNKVSALRSDYMGCWLSLVADNDCSDINGYAFGVKK